MPHRYTLKLAHINDTHSHFDSSRVHFSVDTQGKSYDIYSHSGGYARIKYQLTKAREEAASVGQEFLFLHAGDSFQGTLYFNHFKGVANAHLLNLLQPDAMVLGNHEVDDGSAPILAFLNDISFPLLAGNMDMSQEASDKCSPIKGHKQLFDYDDANGRAKVLIKPLKDKQVAIIGITLDQMAEIARPDPDMIFINAIETTRNTVAHLKTQGIDHILVLSHLGFNQDKILAEQVDGISLIVGGHTHTLQGEFKALGLSSTSYGVRVNNTAILHAGKHAETIGIADVEFNEGGQVISLDGHNYFMLDDQFILESKHGITTSDYDAIRAYLRSHPGIRWDKEDALVTQVINSQYRPAIEALEKQVLGFIPRNLVHTRLPSKSLPHGSEIAPLVCKSIYHEAKLMYPRVDFALHNAGGVRQSLNKGEITVADVVGRLLPFELSLVKYQIRGQHLYEAIESAINSATNNSVTGTGAGSFPYTYGLKYFYDGRKPQGQRILTLEVLRSDGIADEPETWESVDRQEHYFGVSSAYTASGKEGYYPLLQACWQQAIEGLTLPSAFIRFMSHEQSLKQDILPQIEYISHI
ncbi:bifunctional metallophosphatase/5'-nucleotidase [Shewanella canadensis]|uniref:Bifunctional metallophosphatase/5'-nucleotidase n=1 Tax=Shewanella canadensis TaxID=271096 RepID=A0A3S0L0H9_9GAMM|nr:bifunctional metallophosphatase/5'-nucleotidase [Shewanella canadensis]RTR38460.1 bifunctional metallophosphatase/5'-nucleotidase [Shewanella canadensis]